MPRSATRIRPGYSRAERISDAVVHVTGLAVVLIAAPVLVMIAAQVRGDLSSLAAAGIYGTALVAMIFFSALFNLTPGAPLQWLYQRLDHAAIYLKIAGTYTPFTLLSGHGTALTLGLWGAAAFGVTVKLVSPSRWRWFGLALYLGMGWAGVVAGQTVFAALPASVLTLMIAGGVLYTVGVGFYLCKAMPFHYTTWHVLVLLASLLFYAAVVVLLLSDGPGMAASP